VDYRFAIDAFRVSHTGPGAFSFVDEFDNDPPPQDTGSPYFASGAFSEADGRAIMDSALGAQYRRHRHPGRLPRPLRDL
jgi:hypothetical protein